MKPSSAETPREVLIKELTNHPAKAIAIESLNRNALTFQEFRQQIGICKEFFERQAVSSCTRIAVLLPNGPEMLVAIVGVMNVATCAPLNPRLKPRELEFCFADLGIDAVIVSNETPNEAVHTAQKLDLNLFWLDLDPNGSAGKFSLRAERASRMNQKKKPSHGPALVLHTSGTTSKPKIVPLSHANISNSIRNISTSLSLSSKDKFLNIMPMFHIAGLSCAMSALYSGSTVFCGIQFDETTFYKIISSHKPTWYAGSPAMHKAVLDSGRRHLKELKNNSLRFVRSSSAPMTDKAIIDLEALLGAPVINSYAMTEACGQIACRPLNEKKPNHKSVGLPGATKVAIFNDKGESVTAGIEGEIVIQGPAVIHAYEGISESSSSNFTGGWFRTGDQGYLDQRGYLYVTGRIKEIVNRGGEKIMPGEVDDVLGLHPAVAECASFSVPHPSLGEDIAAAIVLKKGHNISPSDVRNFAFERLADFKVPQSIVVVDKLPRSNAGKVLRTQLAQDYIRNIEGNKVPPRNETEKTLCNVFAETLGLSEVGIHDNFFRIGGDSLNAIAISMKANKAGLSIQPAWLFRFPTVGEIAAQLSQVQSAQKFDLEAAQPSGEALRLKHFVSNIVNIAVSEIEEVFPVLPMQSIMTAAVDKNRKPSILHSCWTLKGRLDVETFKRAWENTIEKTTALRTGFATCPDDGQLVQFVVKSAPIFWEIHDWQNLDSENVKLSLSELKLTRRELPFDLGAPPLFRLDVCKTKADENIFLITWQHAIIDRWSRELVWERVIADYNAFLENKESQQVPGPSYREYVLRMKQKMQDPVLEQFWQDDLKGFNWSNWEKSFLRLRSSTSSVAEKKSYRFNIAKSFRPQVELWCRQHELTTATLLSGAWAALIRHLTELDDVVFTTLFSGRAEPLAGIDQIVGNMLAPASIRASFTGNLSAEAWLKNFQRKIFDLQNYLPLSAASLFSLTPKGIKNPFWCHINVENVPRISAQQTGVQIADFEMDAQVGSSLVFEVVLPDDYLKVFYNSELFSYEHIIEMVDKYFLIIDRLTTGKSGGLALMEEVLDFRRPSRTG